jgi:2-keto-3-deoxy-L-fuconate dehydrogenase
VSVLGVIVANGTMDIVVNTVDMANIGTVETTSAANFERAMRVDVSSYFYFTKAVVSHMRDTGGSGILNMSSTAGSSGLADRFAYPTRKGAVIVMTHSVARVHTPFVDGYLRNTYPGREDEMYKMLSVAHPIDRMLQHGLTS